MIVGGGVIGLTLARELHKKGIKDIAILESGEIGKESSFAAAGMLAPQAEADSADPFFDFCIESKDLFPTLSNELLDETGIDIELDKSGTLYPAFTQKDIEEIRSRFGWQKAYELEVEHLSAHDTHKLEPFISSESLESLFFPNDWQVENRKLLIALKKYAEINGIGLIENVAVSKLVKTGSKIERVVASSEKHFSADKIVITAGAWSSLIEFENSSPSFPKVKPIRGQMISFQTAKRLFTRVIYSPRGYIVPRKDGKILAGATVEDVKFDSKTTDEGIRTLIDSTSEISPALSRLPIDKSWAGLRPFTSDGLPIIGALSNADNLFIATAHYRNGILLAPMTAKILADKIVFEKDSRFLELCDPNRSRNAQTR